MSDASLENGAVLPRVTSQMTADDVIEDQGGFDYGWSEANVALADPLFSNLLMDAGVSAVASALVRGADNARTPMLLLTGTKAEPLREAFALFRRWQDMSGPGAVRLEIAFDGAGFRIAVLPDALSLRWRCCGFGNISKPDTFNLAWVKSIDTRSDFIESLADYCGGPFSPVYLGAALVHIDADGQPYASEIDDVPHILLPSLPLYRQAEDIPAGSFLAGVSASESSAEPLLNPSLIATQRAWRLLSIMPKTVHILRHTESGAALVDQLVKLGVTRWQVEQAIANLRLASIAEWGDSPPQSHWIEIHSLRLGHIELADEEVDLAGLPINDILEQIRRDARFLLRRIGRLPPAQALAACQTALREAGYA